MWLSPCSARPGALVILAGHCYIAAPHLRIKSVPLDSDTMIGSSSSQL
jgi:hypothetical protein